MKNSWSTSNHKKSASARSLASSADIHQIIWFHGASKQHDDINDDGIYINININTYDDNTC